jgi:peroxiredoxin
MKKSKSEILACILALAAFLLAALPPLLAADSAPLEPAASRQPAPDFSSQDADGAPFRLSDYRGRVVVLNFWATWCRTCKTEVPWYIAFQNSYKDRGLAILGVSMDGIWKPVQPFLVERNINYRVALADEKVGALYQVHELPVTLLIDKNGRIAQKTVGISNRQSLEKNIQTLLVE